MPKEEEIRPSTLTLFFKQGKQTILLFVDASRTFSSIKAELLEVLQEVYPTGIPNSQLPGLSIPLPESPDGIALAVPVDNFEPQNGWTEIDELDVDTQSPKSLNLKDGGYVAFIFIDKETESREFYVEWPIIEDEADNEDTESEAPQ